MTTIVGVQHEWGCEIVADGLTVTGNDRCYTGEGMEKVVERGPFLLAAAGLGAFTEPFMSFDPSKPRSSESILEYVRTRFVPEFRVHLQEQSGLALDNTDTEATNFEGLVALGGQLFAINDDGSVLVSRDGRYGIGGGSNFAMGALSAGASAMEAVLIACTHHLLSGPPVVRLEQRRG